MWATAGVEETTAADRQTVSRASYPTGGVWSACGNREAEAPTPAPGRGVRGAQVPRERPSRCRRRSRGPPIAAGGCEDGERPC